MAKTAGPVEGRPRARRLTAEERRRSILEAARKSFGDTGDMNGTTMRTIADRAGISEGVIYRHFESKDQLFYEAVVEPLREAVDALVEATADLERQFPLPAERQLESLADVYETLTSMLAEVLPLLGLVLFGDPEVATRFYREHFAVAMDRLASAWQGVEERFGVEVGLTPISTRAVIGTALILALESTHSEGGEVSREMFDGVARGTARGYFPAFAGRS
ncbi:TetR/AcrR family transcriptional regulator [Dermatobacter hominis]|uniref:TetR/AcrR family transcriptional regulator n=1 Tax=Dermatobacter hominis TaxID=2884263 RepID=UPI001D10F2AD|nr:TetR/AcrR family transcriptional regulator [Dermatobacter hominis]UDY36632.1 TetR/AcrR family transcriptional regulator [Dermatobacter hominis]